MLIVRLAASLIGLLCIAMTALAVLPVEDSSSFSMSSSSGHLPSSPIHKDKRQTSPKTLWHHRCGPEDGTHPKDGVRHLHTGMECDDQGATPTPASPSTCDEACWSRYIRHTYGHNISPAQGVTGIVCIIIGVYFLLFGYRFFRPSLALTGFVFFACLTWIGLANNEPMGRYPRADIVYVCVSTGIGIIGGFVFMLLYTIAIYFVGALGGLFLSVFILSWKESLVIQIVIARACLTLGVAIAMIALVFLAERYTIIFATAFTGAYLFILGMDLFIHTGFVNAWLLNFDGNIFHDNSYLLQTRVYVMLAFVLFITLLSAGWQYYWCVVKLGRYFGINVTPKEEEKA